MKIAMKVLSRRSRTKIDIIKIKMRTRELTPTTTTMAYCFQPQYFATLVSHLQLQRVLDVIYDVRSMTFCSKFIALSVFLYHDSCGARVSHIIPAHLLYISQNFRQINGSEHTSCSFALDNAMRCRMIMTIMSLVVSSLLNIAIDVCCSETAACSQSPCDIPSIFRQKSPFNVFQVVSYCSRCKMLLTTVAQQFAVFMASRNERNESFYFSTSPMAEGKR